MWKPVKPVGHKLLLQGSAKEGDLSNILNASAFAAKCGLIKKDNQYSFITFCIQFATTELLKTKISLENGEVDAAA